MANVTASRHWIRPLSINAELDFAFWTTRLELNQSCLLDMQMLRLEATSLVTYLDVLVQLFRNLLGYKMQHTDCLLACGLLDQIVG